MSAKAFDPSAHTVEQVNEHLSGLDPESGDWSAVMDAERAGKARKGILGDDSTERADAPPVEAPALPGGRTIQHVSGPALS
jgi:hypothetical protein